MVTVHAAPVRRLPPPGASPDSETGPSSRPPLEHAGEVTPQQSLLDRLRRLRRKPGLRAQVTLFFMLIGLVVSVSLSIITYVVARNYLLDQRERTAKSQALANAALIQTRVRDLSDRGLGPIRAIDSVSTERDGFALLVLTVDGDTVRRSSRSPLELALPAELLEQVGTNGLTGSQKFPMRTPSQQFASLDGEPYLAFGVNLRSIDAAYYEAFPLSGSERTLRVIGTSLIIGSAVTTAAAAGLGLWNSRRLMRPLSRVADAASELASGSLDVRLDREDDPDLGRLADSFNAMANAVQTRIEREARFASDVSHELRSPITALSAAVDMLDARREEFPGRTGQALDVVVTQVRRFDQMVLDLLELSRLDAGATEVNLEPLQLEDTIRRIAQRYGYNHVPIVVDAAATLPVNTDKLRLERIMANLLDNAKEHAGGPARVTIARADDHVEIAVEDAGPGIAAAERERIFERFARGAASRHRVGTGLGLALVAEHATALGGRAWVEDREPAGARFVVSLPVGGPR